ncbi:hypothetical protein Hamer_G001049 [Homarus americanus]|uniref:Uncharacterized protein n=1 Tax=Homarus americanus TaxID=6706 RepID=A0A8J5T2C7_HOMAM|nr:hypothetical protein Hamer_G001049 [Homarus americanus]
MLDALAFLPLEDVIEGMKYLKTVIPSETEELLMYFDRTYVSGSFRLIQQPVAMPSDALMPMRMRHTSSMFAPHLWNVHDATMNNNARTNDICAGWNNKFFNLVGHYHPSIWLVIEWFQLEEATVSTIIKQDAVGNPPQGRVRQRYGLFNDHVKPNSAKGSPIPVHCILAHSWYLAHLWLLLFKKSCFRDLFTEKENGNKMVVVQEEEDEEEEEEMVVVQEEEEEKEEEEAGRRRGQVAVYSRL